MKTFNKIDVFTCVNAEEAKKYIGKLGYFANGLNGFSDIGCYAPYSLDYVQVGIDKPFRYKESCFALFLPAEKVIEAPKKYRPFRDIEELKRTLGVELGDVVIYRRIGDLDGSFYALFDGHLIDGGEYRFCLSSFSTFWSFQMAFDSIEYRSQDGTWKPFGVEE